MALQDQRERDRIRQELDSSFLVEAGAGTGKTSLLIDRILALLTQKKVAPERIVALTFTEKAAYEMKERLYKKLDKTSIPIHMMFVGTIHAFAHKLLKEKEFILFDETYGNFFFIRVWNEWLFCELSHEEHIFFRAQELGVSLSTLYNFTRELYRYRDVLSDYVPEKISFSLDDFYTKIFALMMKIEKIMNENLIDTTDLGFLEFSLVKKAIEDKRVLSTYFKKGSTGNAKNWKDRESYALFKEMMSELKVQISHGQRLFFHNLMLDIVSKLNEFYIFFNEKKALKNYLDFDDLLLNLRNALKNTEFKNYWKGQFDYFLIDEFQDTDPLQMDIVLALSHENKLFIVGDPKQSIYRFRRADIEMYKEIKTSYFTQDSILAIRQNFRSVSSIIDFINRIFGEKMKLDYIPLVASLELKSFREESIMIIETPALPATLQRKEEAKKISSIIKKLNKEENIALDDIGVIFPQTSDIFIYQDTFRTENIPVRFLEKEFYARDEIKGITNVLTLFKNPADKIALVATLKSDLFGCIDKEILLLENNREWASFLDAPLFSNPHLADVFVLLKKLYAIKDTCSVPQFLRKIYDETNIHSAYLSNEFQKKKAYNIEKLIRKAYVLNSYEPLTLSEFTDWLINTKLYAFDEISLDEEIQNAVRFLTIHKAKGLEFKVVILANLFSERRYSPRIIIDRIQKSMALKLGSLTTYNYDKALQSEKKKDTNEMIRLLYVAMTRAKELLVIPYVQNNESLYYEIMRDEIEKLTLQEA